MLFLLLWLGLVNPPVISQSTPNKSYTYYHRGSRQDKKVPTEGGLALVGGAGDRDEVFRWMADRGGNGDFLVLRGSGADGYQDYIDKVAEVNSVSTLVLHEREAAHDPFVLEKVKNAEAIFFAGGDQWNYVGKWKDTPLQTALNNALATGVPVGGTSAGLAILGEHVYSAEKASVTSPEVLADPYHPGLTLESDFLHASPLEGAITDTHFAQRERMGRLVTFMARLQQDGREHESKGIGVDEQTAVLVTPDGRGRVVGEHQAYFVRTTGLPEECRPGTPLTHSGLEVYRLSSGEEFDFGAWSSEHSPATKLRVTRGKLEATDS